VESFYYPEIPAAGIDLLKKAGLQVEVYPHDQPIPESLLLEKIRDCDALLSMVTDPISAALIEQAGQLKIIAIMPWGIIISICNLQAAGNRGYQYS